MKIKITKTELSNEEGIYHEGVLEKHEVPYPFIIKEYTDEGGKLQFRVEFTEEQPHADFEPEVIEAFHQYKHHIDGVEVSGLEIVIDGDHTNTEIDLGALYLKRDGRETIFDCVQSYRRFENGQTLIQVILERGDNDTFEDCKFDLRAEDLYAGDLDATFFFSCEEDWEYCTLFIRRNDSTKAIDVSLD